MVYAEALAASIGDLALLDALWAEDARITDRRGQSDPAGHYRWEGKAAVLNRYVVAVFPHAPPAPEPDAFHEPFQWIGDLPGGMAEGEIVAFARGPDQWRIIHREGRWWLLELSYTSR